ncbi:MAG: hypothetical protein CMI16_07515 [Opitutaceae bacterium]|nr:hypothetical protein [Opitutaceae bacterium]
MRSNHALRRRAGFAALYVSGKLVGSGRWRAFQATTSHGKPTGVRLRGVTKRLEHKLFSAGALPSIARRADPKPGGHWKGPNGGRNRGAKVDAQLTRLINAGPSAWKNVAHVYVLTRIVLTALRERGLEPVVAQRVVLSEAHRIGTAADIVCYSASQNRLVVVELKCGHDHGRKASATLHGRACAMRAPFSKVSDCVVHRHLAQLAVTRELLLRETALLTKLAELGVGVAVDGLLLYANDEGAEFFALDTWWQKRSAKLLATLA